MGPWRTRRRLTPPEATKAESISGPTNVSNVRRAAGGWSEEPGSGVLGGLRELPCLLEEGVRGVILGAARCGVRGERIGGFVVVRTGDRRRQRKAGRVVGRPTLPVLEERVELATEVFERLAGKGLEGRSPLALLARRHVRRRTRPSRDELADDDVLLETDEVVLGAVDGGLGQHPGRLLEGGRREEARRIERCLGHAEQDGLGRRRLATLRQDAVVVLLELEAIDELGRQQVDVARLIDADLAEHLPDDDLDVLVVDR